MGTGIGDVLVLDGRMGGEVHSSERATGETVEDSGRDRRIGLQVAATTPTRRAPLGRVVLRVEELEKRYRRVTAVSDLSFELHEGEVLGLLGPNGAGKTTTVSILATERQPTAGDAVLFGHSIRDESTIVRGLIGLAPQNIALYPMLTAEENLRFFGRMYGVERGDLGKRVDELLHLVGLEKRRNDYVVTLSGGMKRRLNLAVALVHRPKLLLLDEPTAGVDPHSRQAIFEILRGLREAGIAILYLTHHMEEAEGLCDRIGIMNQGRLVAIGTLEMLLSGLDYSETIELHGFRQSLDLSSLRHARGVRRIENSDGVLRLFVNDAASLLEPLQTTIRRSAESVQLRIAPLSLEHIFLHLTGRGMHD